VNPALQDLSIVIPAYNEAARIAPTLDRIRAWTAEHAPNTEILVVNDGSSDNTTEVAQRALQDMERSRVLENPGNRGKGYSVRHGVLEASGAWILMSDADLSTPIEELAQLVEQIEDNPVVIGSRGMDESEILEHQPLYRETMGRIFNLMVQAIALPGIRDSQCGFKLFRRDVARDVFARTTIDGFGFDVEVLFLALRLGHTIAEVPVRWINDEASTVHPIKDSARMAADLVRVRLRHRKVESSASATHLKGNG
jgi:dolichyl-phosphate beta-glucosyltransferase